MRISTNDKNTLDRNPGDGTMNSSSVTAFLLSPHWRIYRHILLQVAVLLITINVFWYEPLQVVSLLKRFGGCLVYFLSMNAVIYTNLYILVPSFLLKNRLGGYVLAAIVTNLVVILFLSVTQGMLFEVILPVRNPDGFATFINTFSGILTMGFVTAGSAAISLFTHWLRHNLRIDQLESTTLQSELKFLKSQINPHFLYNTLDSITWMIEGGKNEEASFMITQLAKLFRISLSKGHTIIPVRDELLHAKSYMNIQKVRYKNKFEVSFEVDEEIMDYCAVKLVLQPLLENAIYYGVGNMDEDDGGMIIVSGKKKDEDILITIEDNGMGMREEVLENILTDNSKVPKHGSGVGVINVHSRIRLMFGEEYGLSIESEPDEGTRVTIRIPAIPYTPENAEALELQKYIQRRPGG